MKTRFSNSIIIKLIENVANTVPGVKKIQVEEGDIDFEKNKITVDVWFKKNVLNIKSISTELQKTIYYYLSQQLDNFYLAINVRVHI